MLLSPHPERRGVCLGSSPPRAPDPYPGLWLPGLTPLGSPGTKGWKRGRRDKLLISAMGAGLGGKALLCEGPAGTRQGCGGLETRAPTPGYEALGVPLLQVVGGWVGGSTHSFSSGQSHADGQEAYPEPGLPWSPVTLTAPAGFVRVPPGSRSPAPAACSPPRRGSSLVGGGGG